MGYCCVTKSGREPEFQTAGEVGVFPNRPESINPIESSEPNVLRKDWPNRNRQALNFDHRSSILVNTKGRVRLKQRRNWSGEFRVKQRAIKIDRPPGRKAFFFRFPVRQPPIRVNLGGDGERAKGSVGVICRRRGLPIVQRRHRLYLRELIPLFSSGSACRKLLLKCLGAFFEFLRTHIFDMGGDSPEITKSIGHRGGTITIEHVLRLSV
jgi:hypothetical protein